MMIKNICEEGKFERGDIQTSWRGESTVSSSWPSCLRAAGPAWVYSYMVSEGGRVVRVGASMYVGSGHRGKRAARFGIYIKKSFVA